MLSRVAESVFWMARYIERVENIARFVEVNQHLTVDLGEEQANQWQPLVYTTGDYEQFEPRYGQPTRENVLRFLTFDRENPNSILCCLQRARENARIVREVISAAVWEELNIFYLMVRDAAGGGEVPDDFYYRVKRASHLLVGVADATMSHGEAWHFSRLGRLLERADKTSRILDVKYFILLPNVSDVGTSLDIVQWSALLKSTSALEVYRRLHGRIVPLRVAEFLVLDHDFPRSMRFCVLRAEGSLRIISGAPAGGFTGCARTWTPPASTPSCTACTSSSTISRTGSTASAPPSTPPSSPRQGAR
jgi:uncharacterized alpha-E superfamily protein